MPSSFVVGDTIYFFFDTYDSNGASVTITGLATTDIDVYKDGGTTPRASEVGYALLDTDGIDFAGAVGLHGFSINTGDNTVAGFWANGSQYLVHVNALTVDAQTVRFSYYLVLGLALRPTTAGRTLDVSAGGEAGLDWANIGSPTTAQNLSGTNIDVDQVVASVSGNVGGNVTGSVGSVAAGGLTATSIATDAITAAKIATDTITEIQSGLATSASIAALNDLSSAEAEAAATAALVAVNLDHLVGTATGIPALPDDTYLDLIMTNGTDAYVRTTHSLQAAVDNAADLTELGTLSGLLLNTTIATATTQTSLILAAGSNDNDAYLNQTVIIYDVSDSNFPSVRKCTDYVGSSLTVTLDAGPDFTVVDNDLIRIFAAAPGSTAPTVTQIADEVQTRTIAAVTTVNGLAANVVTASAIAANAITDTKIASGAFTAAKFAAGALLSVWDTLESAIVTASSIGLKLKTNLDAAISTRSTYAGGDTSGTTTLLSRIVGTLAAGTHQPSSGDTYTRLGAPAGASVSADIAAIEAQTDDIGVAGAGLTALGDTRLANLDATVSSRATQTSVDDLPTNSELTTALSGADDATLAAIAALNDLSSAEAEAAATAALVAMNLDHLIGTATGIPASPPAGTFLDQIMDDGTASFDRNIHSLQAAVDNGSDLAELLDNLVGPLVTVAADGSNSATSFKIDLTALPTDGPVDAWLSFNLDTTTVALRGQVKRVTDFNTSTDMVTVASAFTTIPQAGDTARLVTR